MPRGTTTGGYTVVEAWEKRPEEEGYLDAAGVAVGLDDRVYVLTRMPARVMVYEPNGNFLTSWGSGLFSDRAHGITAAPDGSIYCVDDAMHQVTKFTPDGQRLLTLGSGHASDTGYDGKDLSTIQCAGPPFNRPTNVAIVPDGDIYVADGYGNCCVHRFSSDGELRYSWGSPGERPGEFNLVHGIAVVPDGRILVADRENERIQVFDPAGQFLQEWLDVQRPTQVAYDPNRQVLVVSELGWRPDEASRRFGQRPEFIPSRVSVLDLDGTVLDRFGGPIGPEPGSFVAAHGVAVDSHSNVYVAEVTYTIGVSRGLAPPDAHTMQKFTFAS